MAERDTRSPLDLALARFRAKPAVRYGLAVLAVFVLVAIYAPFLCSETALVWWDDSGLSLPVLADFLNRKRFDQLHDLFFNLASLLLPLWIVGGVMVRRQIRPLRWSVLGLAVLLAAVVACLVPVVPTAAGWRPLWRDRQEAADSIGDLRDLQAMHVRLAEHGGDLAAALRADDVVRLADGRQMRVLEVVPPTPTEPAVLGIVPVGGGEFELVPLAEASLPGLPRALFPPIPHSPSRNYAGHPYAGPLTVNGNTGARYWLGSNATGRDILALMIYGARISLTIGLYATAISMAIGILVGAVSGYLGGWIDILLQRLVEIVMTLPGFIIVLIVVATFGRNIFVIMTVIGLVGWTGTARLVRGEFLQQMGAEYVLAGQALGLSSPRIMLRHILPNAMTPLLISATFAIAGAVLTESGLAFIGLGDPQVPSWGGVLAEGRETKLGWMIYTPGLAIFLLVSALNLIGDGLREALDPKHAE